MTRKILALVIICVLVMTAMTTFVRTQAQSIERASVAPLDSGFTYQGVITKNGTPVNGVCNLRFSLFNAVTAGTQLGADQTINSVGVVDGRFTVTLNNAEQFGTLDGTATHLEVEVRCAGDSGWLTLSPRQPLTAAPAAHTLVPGAQINNSPGSGLSINSTTFNGLRIAGAGTNGVYVVDAATSGVVIGNSGGIGFRVIDAGSDGVRVEESKGIGVNIGNTASHGVHVNNATGTGILVDKATGFGLAITESANHGVRVGQTGGEGFRVVDANFNGLLVDSAGKSGVNVKSAVGDGMFIESAQESGIEIIDSDLSGLYMHNAGRHGVFVGNAGNNGFFVDHAGAFGLAINEADDHGIRIAKTGGEGVRVLESTFNGFVVNSAGRNGIYVENATLDGIRVDGAGGYAGNFNGDIRVTGSVESSRIANSNGRTVAITYTLLEGPEAAAYTRGTATLIDGAATVILPDYYLSVANPETMTVQVTPLSSDSMGLAVVEKNENGFIVRELMNGTGSYEFDYTVMAVRSGYEDLEVVRSLDDASQTVDTSEVRDD